MDDERSLKVAVRELGAALEEDLRDHPEPEELLGFAAGDMAPEERERCEEHLALCRACARTVLNLKALADLEIAPAESLPAAVVSAEWERFRQAAGISGRAFRPGWFPVAPPRVPWGLAAALLLVVVGLTWHVSTLTQTLDEASGPRGDVFVADLLPVGEGIDRSEIGAAEAEEIHVPVWAGRVLLILTLADPHSASEYRVEVVQEGREIWSGAGIRRTQDGTLALELPRQLLSSGVYRVRLYASADTAVPVAEYAIRIVPPEVS